MFDTILDRALFDYQAALAARDYPLAWQMEKKLVYMSANRKIYDACVPFINDVDRELRSISSYEGVCAVDRASHQIFFKRNFLEEMVYKHLPKIMLLLDEEGLLHKPGGSRPSAPTP